MAFDIHIGGVGDAFSTTHYGTHFLLRKGDFVLAVDCPDHFLRALKENEFTTSAGAPLDVAAIDAVLITHLHGDHVNGLEMTAAYRRFALQKEPLPVYGIREVTEALWPKRMEVSLGQMWNGEGFESIPSTEYFEMHTMDWEASNQIGPFGVELRRTIHHLPCTALKITDGDKTLAYSCDTAFDEGLIEWLRDGSDLILHESTFGKAHTPLHRLQELDEEVQRRMRIVHYSDQMIGMDAGLLRFARQGEVITLG